MERVNPDTGVDPFPALVEGEFALKWFDFVIVEDLLPYGEYPRFKQNIKNALEGDLFSSPNIARHITAIFNMQEGYALGATLSGETMNSLTLLRCLLIELGPVSTWDGFRAHVLDTLNYAKRVIREGSRYRVYAQSDTLHMQQVLTNEWLESASQLTGLLKYWLGVTGEQLIFQQRWGLSKRLILGVEGNHWEPTWKNGSLKTLALNLWKEKSIIERILLSSGRTIDYTLKYSDIFGDEDERDEEDLGEGKVLKFWPQSGKTEWIQSADADGQGTAAGTADAEDQGFSRVTAEQFRISENLFLSAMSRREAARQTTAAAATTSNNIPQFRLNGFSIEKNTAPQMLEDRSAKSQTYQDYNPQIQSPGFAIARVTTPLGGSITGQHTTPQALSGQFTTDQTGEYVAPNIQLHRSIIHDATLQLEPNTPVTGHESALHVDLDRIATDQGTSSRSNPEMFATNQTDQNATPPGQPHQDITGQDMYATKHESALQINAETARTSPDTVPQVQPAQSSTAQDTLSNANTNMFAADDEAALQVRSDEPSKWSWEQKRLMTGKDTAQAGKLEDSKSCDSTRKSPDIPNTIPFSTAPPLSDRNSMVPAESNLYASMATAPPTRPLPSLPRGKAVENESVTEVEAPSAEELSDTLISNYAEGLLVKHRQLSKVVYPVEEYDSDLKGETPSRGCELETLGNETQKQQEAGSHTTDRDSGAAQTSEGSAIDGQVAAEETNTGHVTSNHRPCLRIDMADVEERLAVLDAAELRAVEERNQQDKRSSAEQNQLDLPERDLRLEEELQHSTDIKEELLDKLESEKPLNSKIRAVEEFFDAVGEEIEKVNGWTEELLEAEAKIDGGNDGGWEGEMQNQKMQADEHMQNIRLNDRSVRSVTGSDTSDYTRAGPSSPTEDRDAKQVYTAEEYAITSPPTLTGN
ncbi:hypothetical protein MFRU_045g00390 [Monilinia fructicola]|nr:hypothetical protein MFRU_045g00390 [Monilinia fructicola]